jgi:hypothetical protein
MDSLLHLHFHLSWISQWPVPHRGQAPSPIAAPVLFYSLRNLYNVLFVRKGKHLPAPPEHWLLGHVPLVAKVVGAGHHIDFLVRQLQKNYGKLFRLNFLMYDLVFVLEPEAIKEVGCSA